MIDGWGGDLILRVIDNLVGCGYHGVLVSLKAIAILSNIVH